MVKITKSEQAYGKFPAAVAQPKEFQHQGVLEWLITGRQRFIVHPRGNYIEYKAFFEKMYSRLQSTESLTLNFPTL
ncbi:MAG: hypothetical protein ACTJHT_11930 [Sphingobacterium sp.]